MLRILVYGFAAVSAMVATAVVVAYIYLARLPVEKVLEKGREYVDEQVEGARRFARMVRETKEQAEETTGAAEKLRRAAEELKRSLSRRVDETPAAKPGYVPASDEDTQAASPPAETPTTEQKPPEAKPQKTAASETGVGDVPQGKAKTSPPEPPAEKTGTPPAEKQEEPRPEAKPKPAVQPDGLAGAQKKTKEETERKASRQKPLPENGVHIVKKGESLYLIAKRYYGSGLKWKRIAAANKIAKPNRIKPGMKIVIPPAEAEVKRAAPKKARFPVVISAKDLKPIQYSGGRGL